MNPNARKFILLPVFTFLLVLSSGCFRVSSDTRAMRDAVLDHTSCQSDKQIELSLGRLTFGLVGFGSRYVDMPPEARSILKAVKGGEVSVYKLHGSSPATNCSDILNSSDNSMKKRGWMRLVGVLHDRDLVAVYIPQKLRSAGDVRVAVLVLNGHDLVCVSAHSDLEPLLDLALEKAYQEMAMR
jgi:hypothetical protein